MKFNENLKLFLSFIQATLLYMYATLGCIGLNSWILYTFIIIIPNFQK